MQFSYGNGKRVRGEDTGVNLPPPTSDLTPPTSDLTTPTSDSTPPTSDSTNTNFESNSPVQEISAAVAGSKEDHPQVLAPASLIMRSAVSNVEQRLFFNIELNGIKLLGMLDDGSVYSYLGKGVSKEFAGKLEQEAALVRVTDGGAVKLQGVLNMIVSIDNKGISMPFRVADELQYGCILAIEHLR